MALARVFHASLAITAAASFLRAQSPAPDSGRAPPGAQFIIPVGSAILPGLGQYIYKAPVTGLAYTGLAVSGILVSGGERVPRPAQFPRESRAQRSDVGWQFLFSAAWLSSWDSFHRGLPQLKDEGKYDFLPERESVSRLISAPLDYRFLRRWTTWVDIGQTVVTAAVVATDRRRGAARYPLRLQDVGYTMSLSGNAAVGEEAAFRGYLLPLLYEQTGRRFWLANTTQAAIFTAAHGENAATTAYIGAWAAWEGWIVKRNDWSLRESVFHHFWYDFAVVTAEAFAVERRRTARVVLPTIRF
jgi:hypothetical protein